MKMMKIRNAQKSEFLARKEMHSISCVRNGNISLRRKTKFSERFQHAKKLQNNFLHRKSIFPCAKNGAPFLSNKKAISEIISTVLLIVMAIAMAGAVYSWMKFYVEKPLPEESCPDGVSLIIEQYRCDADAGTINLTVQNHGLFDITGFSAKFNNETGNETSTELYGKYVLKEMGLGNNPVVYPLSSGESKNFEFSFAGYGKIAQIELGPFKGYDNYSRPIFCEKAIIRQRISDCNTTAAPAAAGNCPDGMVGYWKGENNADDYLGLNNGIEQGSIGYTTGQVGQAFSLDGTSNIGLGQLSAMTDFTLMAWVYADSAYVNDWNGIIGAGGDHTRWIRRHWVSGFLTGGYQNSSLGFTEMTGATLNVNQWSHVAYAYNGTHQCLYINGAANCLADTAVPNPGPPTVQYYIGLEAGGTRYWKGLIDEAAIFNRGLSATEINALYQKGLNKKGYC